MAESGEGLTPEQLIEQFRQMKVSDLLLSTLFTLSQLAYGKLEPSARDLDQARIAIDAMRALLPVVEPALPSDAARDFNQVVANLQLAYAAAASEPKASDITSQTAAAAEPASEAGSAAAGDITSQGETGPEEAPAGNR